MRHPFLLVLLFAFLTVACEQQRDRNGILSERAMVDVLYDYQLALALASEQTAEGKLAETEYRYTQAVFRKHMITDQEFQLSLAHYARDPKTMLDITKRVTRRFEEQGGISGTNDPFASAGIAQDTVVLYRNAGGVVLSANGHTSHSVNIPVGSNLNADRLVVSFLARWICREGIKSGAVLITANFDNDSIAQRSESIREYGYTQGITIAVPDGRRVKNVTIDFVQSAQWSKNQQVLAIDDIALRAIVAQKPAASPAPAEAPKSVKSDSADTAAPDTTKPAPVDSTKKK